MLLNTSYEIGETTSLLTSVKCEVLPSGVSNENINDLYTIMEIQRSMHVLTLGTLRPATSVTIL
jgi:hypothetical protein